MTTSTLLSSSALRRVLLGSAAAVLLSLPATAATLTWGTVAGISGDTDVSTTGTFISAYNIGGSNVTLNGVTFTGIGSGTGTSASGAGISNIGFAGASYFTANADANSPYKLLTANYQSLIQSGGYVGYNGSTNNGTFTLSGLTIGNTYSLQIWANDSRGTNAGYGSIGNIATNKSDYTNTAVSLFHNTGYNGTYTTGGGVGQTVIGTFVADAATQAITFTSTPLLNAYQLRDITASQIPEPSTFAALAGALTLGFSAVRRRARATAA